MTGTFVAIDGESYTTDDGVHRYVLLNASDTGDYIFNPEGLGTLDCFKFLLSLKEKYKKPIFVAFGLNYDVNMMLRDFGKERLIELWKKQRTHWYDYDVEWMPGKWFKIRKGKVNIKIYEVFGFFQTSFVKSLAKWNIEVQDPEALEGMKASRSLFDDDMREQIIHYCQTECRLLSQLMTELRDALRDVGIVPNSWCGAGSIAAALLHREGVREHHVIEPEVFTPALRKACLHAYYGGRTELFIQGSFPTVTEYDICSAYPAIALDLPSLKGATWTHRKDYDLNVPWAIWHVKWGFPEGTILAPFPVRRKQSISYPLQGEGWYHASEVREVITRHPELVTVIEGWQLHPANDDKPFAFISRLYNERRELKRKGHAGEKCLKLGINSVYGKLAQGVGYRGKLPPFQSYFWAGAITAGTRATLFHLGSRDPDNLIMVATDALFFRGVHELPVSDELGGLERVDLTDVFTAQPGVYCATTAEGEEVKRSRGFFAREIDFGELRRGFVDNKMHHVGQYTSHRFVGLGSALMLKDFGAWRTWKDSVRKLSLTPSTKFASYADINSDTIRHTPPHQNPVIISDAYKPKVNGYLDDQVDYAQGREQPLRS